MDLLNARNIYQKTVIWYDWENKFGGDVFDGLLAKIGGPFLRVTKESEVFDLIDSSIRATLIVSDDEGFDLVK